MSTYGYIYTPDRYGDYTRDRIYITEHNAKRRISQLRTRLFIEEPDVFVSHKSDDTDTAEKVAETITKCGLKAYLDAWDPNVDGDGPELVDYIQSVIEYCNSLIAVVSHSTVSSWWVPLEIGIAITKDLHIGTFSYYEKRNFPSYLWKWPVLGNTRDLEKWCRERKEATSTEQFYESINRKYPSMMSQQ